MMLYLVLANLYLAVFYGFYYAFLRKGTFFQWNRIYLLTGLVLAFILPLAEYQGLDARMVYQYQLPTIYLDEAQPDGDNAMVNTAPLGTSIWSYLFYVYAMGCLLMALRVTMNIRWTFRRLRIRMTGEAYSFFGKIRVDETLSDSQSMMAHERIHVRQGHSLDILLMQLVKIFNWFNPVVYWYERSLRLQHEYIADGKTAASDQLGYAQLLVARAIGAEKPLLTHTFSSKQTLKNRVAMLLRDQSPKWSLVRYMLPLPIVVAMVVFATANNYREIITPVASAVQDPYVAFKRELARQIEYRNEAIEHNAQGPLAVTFEKKGDQIDNIQFLNEFGYGQEEAVVKTLQKESVRQLAPEGKHLFVVTFMIQGAKPADASPPPPPVSAEFKPVGEVVIIGYSPQAPPPPPVERSATANAAKKPTEQVENVADDEDVLFQKTEIDPQPPGGMKAFMEFVAKNYDYPQEAIEAGVNGKVLVSFVVEKDGSLSDLKIVQDELGHGTAEAAINVLKKSEKWSPGIQNGRKVRVAYTLPIRMNLQQ